MSGLYENRKTIRELNNLITMTKPTGNEEYFFVLGYPRSDIGKGTLVAQLLANTENSDAIKFDGLLNTNANGRHTAIGHDDFGVYEKFNIGKRWGREHYLLGGELYRDFINNYGENENLQINPHMSLYVEYRIHKMWNEIGKPLKLFIEVGGLISDPEVDPIFTPMIQRLCNEGRAKVIVLSETSYNGEYIKTKTVQSCIETLLERRIEPWLLFARDSKDMGEISLTRRLDNERVLANKIKDNLNYNLELIISVPFFEDLYQYTSYINKRFNPIISKVDKTKILIATNNQSKVADYKLYLGDKYDVLTLKDFKEYSIEIVEGTTSAEENAIAKAKTWCKITGLITLGDDTGFFIHELNGEPGVATRRWGGQLPENTTNEEFWNYLKEKTKNLSDFRCHFEQNVAIAFPDGRIKMVKSINQGILNKDNLKKEYNGTGYPLGAVFESINRKKNWDEMTDEEKKKFDKKLIDDLNECLK